MRISIAERLRPFSHKPGTRCLIPGTALTAQIFPALVRIYSDTKLLVEWPLEIEGPLSGFTVQLDLEKGVIRVWGKAQNGFFRYQLRAEKDLLLSVEKGEIPSYSLPLEKEPLRPSNCERLSLGSHKKQDWELLLRREDLSEILPIWQALGQWTPSKAVTSGEPTLLSRVEEAGKLQVEQALLDLFHAGFEGIFAPRLEDNEYQGYPLPPLQGDPAALLTEGYRLIRALFVRESEDEVAILPQLPPSLHAGRMISVRLGDFGLLDLEWSKKQIRRMKLRCLQNMEVRFTFSPSLKSFRLNQSERLACGEKLTFERGGLYLMDQFQK